jgi:hypothetical protein
MTAGRQVQSVGRGDPRRIADELEGHSQELGAEWVPCGMPSSLRKSVVNGDLFLGSDPRRSVATLTTPCLDRFSYSDLQRMLMAWLCRTLAVAGSAGSRRNCSRLAPPGPGVVRAWFA